MSFQQTEPTPVFVTTGMGAHQPDWGLQPGGKIKDRKRQTQAIPAICQFLAYDFFRFVS